MTPQTIITLARHILQDTDAANYRAANDELVLYVNAGLAELVMLRPDWFTTTGHIECVAGEVEQTITFAEAVALVDVIGIHDGDAVLPFDFGTMQAFHPSWKADTAAQAKQWVAHPADPLRFYIHPKAPASQLIDVRYVRNPAAVALTDTITDVPATAEPMLVDYVVYRAESKDAEHVLSQRAGMYYASFVAKTKGGTA
jgi:hypothetical protein